MFRSSKINKLNSLLQQLAPMKKAIYSVITIMAVGFTLTSCKKVWHCTCSYNNKVMYTEDLQRQAKGDAETMCSKHDSTIAGQVWSCTIY